MVIIRMSVGGVKNFRFYKIIVTDAKNKRDGKFIEKIGFYNPILKKLEQRFYIKKDRLKYWENVGAKLSHKTSKLIKKYKHIEYN